MKFKSILGLQRNHRLEEAEPVFALDRSDNVIRGRKGWSVTTPKNPIKLPKSGNGKRNEKSSSNASHSTGATTEKTPSSLNVGPGAYEEVKIRPGSTWEQMEVDLVQRTSANTGNETANVIVPLVASLSHINPFRTAEPKEICMSSQHQPDSTFEERQKKWLKAVKQSILKAQLKKTRKVVEAARTREKILRGKDNVAKGQHELIIAAGHVPEVGVTSYEFSEMTSHSSIDSGIEDEEVKEEVSGIREFVSAEDDMSATSFEVLLGWLGCWDSFDEEDYDKFDPTGMVIKGSKSGAGSPLIRENSPLAREGSFNKNMMRARKSRHRRWKRQQYTL